MKETRTYNQPIQSSNNRIVGYAAVFNSPATIRDLDGRQFREVIRPNAFDLEGKDIKAFFNHDRNELLGRTSSGTLKVWQDQRGLQFDCQLPEYAKPKIQELVNRHDLTGCSFAFECRQDRWSIQDDMPFRELLAVDVDEVSIVVDPAYSATNCQLRSADKIRALPDWFDFYLRLLKIES